MNTKPFAYDLKSKKWSVPSFPVADSERTLVLVFGAPEFLDQPGALDELRRAYPKSHVVGCSSAGEIHGTTIRDASLSVTATQFDKTNLQTVTLDVASAADSFTAGQSLANKLNRPDLRGVMILSEGLNVNGSELVRGVNSVLDESVVVTGGLSGDGTRFKRTWVAAGPKVKSGMVAAVGFYGDYIQIGHGSKGGWDKFGPERVVTRSEGNVLYELDGKPALALYKEYLGDKAAGLPATGLLFPLALRATSKDEKFLVRTLLAVDAAKQSLTFAGDVPKGYMAQLMKADFERLIGGASLASSMAKDTGTPVGNESLVVAISCVGRRLVLGERTEEEVEAVLDALPKGQTSHITGFYSYGELSPYASGHCDLHNQTMTLTVFSESATPLPRKASKSVAQAHHANGAPSPAAMGRKEPTTARPPAATASNPQIPKPPPVPTTSAVPNASMLTRVAAGQRAAVGATVQKTQRGDVTLVSVAGRLTETFKGEALGRSLSGTVVFDLSEVDRVTSFGVREWLQMMSAADGVKQMFFARCSEAVVNQLGMIKKFSGNAHVVSAFAPYLCDGCGEQFERLLDCERDSEAIHNGKLPDTTCTRCGANGHFDDDARTYFSFATPFLGVAVPMEVRQVIEELNAAAPAIAGDAVDKSVEGTITTLRLNTKMTASLRWPKLLDGIEGQLVVDLSGIAGAEPAGLANFDTALRALPREVHSVQIERAPQALLQRFAHHQLPPNVTITSAVLDGHCSACAVNRAAPITTSAHADVLRRGGEPTIPCKRCNGPLTLVDARQALGVLAASLARNTPSSPVPSVAPRAVETPREVLESLHGAASLGGISVTSQPPPVHSQAPAPAPRGGGSLTGIIGFAAIAGLAFVGWQAGWIHAPQSAAQAPVTAAVAPAPQAAPVTPTPAPAPQPAAPSTSWTSAGELPPAWAERPYVIEGGNVFAVGRSGLGANVELVSAQARDEAILRVVRQMMTDMQGTAIHEFVQARAREDAIKAAPVAARFLAQVGTFATPERMELVTRARDGAVDGIGRYKLSKASYDQALAGYRDTATFMGMTVARVFPLLEASFHTDGDVIVVSVKRGSPADTQGVRSGDVVLSVNGRRVSTTDSFEKVSSDEWSGTSVRGNVALELESTGARHTVRFFKPAPNN